MFGKKVKEGDEFVAVNDGKGGCSLKPKDGNGSGGNYEGLGQVLIFLLFIVALLILLIGPFLFALYASYKGNKGSEKIRSYIVLFFFFTAIAIGSFYFVVDAALWESLMSESVAYQKLFYLLLGLNLIGLLSAFFGIRKTISNSKNLVFSLVLSVVFVGIHLYIYRDTAWLEKKQKPFTEIQLSRACDCYENSYEQTGIHGDYLNASDRERRSKCLDLFTPEDFRFMEDDFDIIYQNMKKACQEQ